MKTLSAVVLVVHFVLLAGCASSLAGEQDLTHREPSPVASPAETHTPVPPTPTPFFEPVAAVPTAAPTAVPPTPTGDLPHADAGEQADPPIFAFFYADWCTACAAQRPTIEKLEDEFGARIDFVWIDVDDPRNREVVTVYRVRAIPFSVLVSSAGEIVGYWVGERPESTLRAALEAVSQPSDTTIEP